MIQALVKDHARKQSVDAIVGEGEGSIFLLHGPPGVGKSLMAKAISELLHKPLYVVSMGELGTFETSQSPTAVANGIDLLLFAVRKVLFLFCYKC
jgi:SpoVK/Ycf46/Vps4 family AAA+-type ATPase